MSCKPKPSTEAPWGSFDVPSNNVSTYQSAFVSMGPPRQQKPFRPTAQHGLVTGGDVPFTGRSTAQDAFMDMKGGPRQSCKPLNNYQEIKWMQPLTTTAGSHFIAYPGHIKNQPCRPALRERDESRFETRSTQQDAYMPFPYARPSEPFYPKEQERVITKFDHTSTSRAAYVPHVVTPFVAAKKPVGAMGTDGGMA